MDDLIDKLQQSNAGGHTASVLVMRCFERDKRKFDFS
jgi:hypothetical protein